MDDLRTQETLDSLADLFLTGTTPPLRRPPAAPVRTPPRRNADDVDSAAALTPNIVVSNQVLDSMGPAPAAGAAASAAASPARSVLDELDGPGSYSLGAPSTSATHYEDEYTSPAPQSTQPLRLHDDDAPRDDECPAQPAHIEAVFLGNLPGFGGPWLTQYAFHLAQQRGPVAILHVIGDRVDLELVTADRQTVRPGIDEPLAASHASTDALINRLDRVARHKTNPVANWLIHLPSPQDPSQLPRAAAIPHWTILCGGDDMAVAAATRLLQTMLQHAGPGDDDAARLIGVMVMGSDEAKAREAIDKFNAAAVGFLRQPVELIGSRRQMTPVHMRPLGGCTGSDLWPALLAFLHDLPAADEPAPQPLAASQAIAAASPVPPTESDPPVYDSQSTAVLEPLSEVEHLTNFNPAPDPAAAAAPLAASHPRSSAASSSSSPRAPRPQTPTQAQPYRDGAPEPAPYRAPQPEPSSINEPDLVTLLTGSLEGGIPLQARYPRQRDTQLLLDQHGKLHLLRRQLGSDLRAALVDLIEARDWVREHIDLIALTQRQCKFAAAAEPTLHLFTHDAKSAVAMVNKLGPFVKLHLLQEVRIGSAKTWVCTEMN